MDELTFVFGSKVYFTDDGYGSLARLVYDPESLELTHLIVETGLLLKRSRVVPVTAVSSLSEAGIYLGLTQDEMSQRQQFHEKEVERPADGVKSKPMVVNMEHTMTTSPMVPMVTEIVREGVSPELKIVSSQTAVCWEDGSQGKLQAVRTWPGNKMISGIVARNGLLFPDTDAISIYDIAQFDEAIITLNPARYRPSEF